MTEWRMIVLLTTGPLLWMVGGSGAWPFHKGWRRFVWPVIAVITLIGYNSWWQVLGVAGTMIGANCAPYGDRTPWWLKCLVFTSLGAHVIFLDPIFGLWWALGTGIICSCLMLLSKRFDRFTWKIVEATFGFLQAAGIILGVLR